MKNVFIFLIAISMIAMLNSVELLAGPGTVTVKLLASDGVTGVPGATVKYYKNGEQTLGTTDANGEFSQYISDIANTTTFYLLPANGGRRIWLGINPADNPTLIAQMTAVTFDLKTCAGEPLTGEALYYRNGWESLGNTPLTVDLLPFTGLGPGQGSYDFRMKYDGRTSQTLRQDISANASVNFTATTVDFSFNGTIQFYRNGWENFVGPKKMIGGTETMNPNNIGKAEFRFRVGNTTVYQQWFNITGCSVVGGSLIRLVDENGNPLPNFSATYRSRCGGSWTYSNVAFTTDANGYALLNTSCSSGKWDGKITITVNQISLEQTIATNSIYQLAKVNVNLKNCPGTPLAGGIVAQGGGHWVIHGTTNGTGTVSFLAFPGNNVKVRMSYNYGSNTIDVTPAVSPVTNIDFTTTKVNLFGNNVKIGVSGWPTISMPIELLPGSYNFRIDGSQINGVNISGCEISKGLVKVKDETGKPVQGATFRYACGGSWVGTQGATDANGWLVADIPACMTKIDAKVGNSSEEMTKAQLQSTNYTFTTEVFRIFLKDHAGNAITDQSGSLAQGGRTWIGLGNFNTSGYVDVQTFPTASGRYKASYNCTEQTINNINVVGGAGIQTFDFQTGQVIGSCITEYVGCGWTTFVNGMEQMPGTRNFKSPTQSATVVAGQITYLNCPPSKRAVDMTSSVVYPNPVTDMLIIGYDVEEASNVRIYITDITGQMVAELFNDHQEAGNYEINWNTLNQAGSRVSVGTYFYVISTMNNTQSGSIQIVR